MEYWRVPWPSDFSDVVVHSSEPERDAHPDYSAAGAGDSEAAIRLAHGAPVTPETIFQISVGHSE